MKQERRNQNRKIHSTYRNQLSLYRVSVRSYIWTSNIWITNGHFLSQPNALPLTSLCFQRWRKRKYLIITLRGIHGSQVGLVSSFTPRNRQRYHGEGEADGVCFPFPITNLKSAVICIAVSSNTYKGDPLGQGRFEGLNSPFQDEAGHK